MRRRVHVIHTPEDEGTASAIRRSLEGGGIGTSGAGSANPRNAEKSIAKLIDTSDLIVVILSSAVNDSVRVKREVAQAVKADKFIVPFRIDTTTLPKYLEFYLSTAHWLDATTPPIDSHLEQLVSTTRRLFGLEAGYASATASLRRWRPAKKAVAAAILGVVSLIALGIVLGPLSVILGKVELKAIASGRSSAAGRGYARAGVIFGLLGTITSAAIWFLMWYYDIDPTEGWRELLQLSSRPGP